MSHDHQGRARTWLQRALLIAGIACLGYSGYMSVEARRFQNEQTKAFEKLLASPPAQTPSALHAARAASEAAAAPKAPGTLDSRLPAPVAPPAPLAPPAPRAPKAPLMPILALLEIPRLELSAPVLSGDDERTLQRAAGHLPDTPKPWEPGNSALAAHRDGLFRPLRHIRIGDEIRVRSTQGEFTYRVRETRIVEPDDLSVLAPQTTDLLTLITCYPFSYVGNAPQRFIVQAVRVGTKN